ncbi:MAG TPA: glycoside hydrolase family 15 protein [Baekduia sp.]|uniref:glycoside hydrolase family 15 protein n=1 Tax=Baekduia sp. TaxID=2600305 RepID=UPI002D78FAC3|nr:glycoside hydrolase family 15 protein [Baekduia sp.]HET6509175.1 glycoside hydrolase family 15 protein [Baekduia sp.]
MMLEDYALLGDLESAALVSRAGAIDWLCVPRFDSPAALTALLGDEDHGAWEVAPATTVHEISRRYRPGTLVLDTRFDTPHGSVVVTDFMPIRGDGPPRLIRIVEGIKGRVPMRMRLRVRPDYGAVKPWLEPIPDGVIAISGPDAFRLSTPLSLTTQDATATAEFAVGPGLRRHLSLHWWPSHERSPLVEDADSAMARTIAWWQRWSGRCAYDGEYADAVKASLIAIKAMTSATTGALIAAPTTSLPEELGGVRNWDYRYCWLRDAALTLQVLLTGGYDEEALAFRGFLERVATGDPADIQIMYGVGGERRLTEHELRHLPGYEASRPVRVGNAASEQFQLDVYGELISVASIVAARLGRVEARSWSRWRAVVEHVEAVWRTPDDGIWETRDGPQHYTYSKVMAWVVLDRALRIAERFGLDAPTERWSAVRDEIHAEVCEHGYDAERHTFTQTYNMPALDAATLAIPLVGFLPADDARVTGTIDAIRDELGRDGLVARCSTADGGPPGDVGRLLACSFWLVSALAVNGRPDEARALFERLLDLRNDVGLLAEEYDLPHQRQLGNFPQAFSHLALIQAATAITDATSPRSRESHGLTTATRTGVDARPR